MTGAPFRDLFVELPRAVFDALHAWGEAVIVKAQVPKPATPAPVRRISTVLDFMPALCARYGWRRATWRRDAYYCTIEILAVLGCDHHQWYSIEKQALVAQPGPDWQIAVLDRVVDSTPRDCYCVHREP